jgi:hypothetical protein
MGKELGVPGRVEEDGLAEMFRDRSRMEGGAALLIEGGKVPGGHRFKLAGIVFQGEIAATVHGLDLLRDIEKRLEDGIEVSGISKKIAAFQKGIDRPRQGSDFGRGEFERVIDGATRKFLVVVRRDHFWNLFFPQSAAAIRPRPTITRRGDAAIGAFSDLCSGIPGIPVPSASPGSGKENLKSIPGGERLPRAAIGAKRKEVPDADPDPESAQVIKIAKMDRRKIRLAIFIFPPTVSREKKSPIA